MLKAQSSINILEFSSFQLCERGFSHFSKMEVGISPSFKTVGLLKEKKSKFPIFFQISEKVRIFQWGKATVTGTKFPPLPLLRENIPVFVPKISENIYQSPAPESPGVTAASRAFPRKRHMYRLYFYYSSVWRMQAGGETTSLQWTVINADKQGRFAPYTNG